jgi:hypothetical protein
VRLPVGEKRRCAASVMTGADRQAGLHPRLGTRHFYTGCRRAGGQFAEIAFLEVPAPPLGQRPHKGALAARKPCGLNGGARLPAAATRGGGSQSRAADIPAGDIHRHPTNRLRPSAVSSSGFPTLRSTYTTTCRALSCSPGVGVGGGWDRRDEDMLCPGSWQGSVLAQGREHCAPRKRCYQSRPYGGVSAECARKRRAAANTTRDVQVPQREHPAIAMRLQVDFHSGSATAALRSEGTAGVGKVRQERRPTVVPRA